MFSTKTDLSLHRSPVVLTSSPWDSYLSYPWIRDVQKDKGINILSYLDDKSSLYLLLYVASNWLALLRRICAFRVLPLFGTKEKHFLSWWFHLGFDVDLAPGLGKWLNINMGIQMGTYIYGWVVYCLLEAFEFKLASLLV